MVNIVSQMNSVFTLNIRLQGGGGMTRTADLPPFGQVQITDGEYTENPDYYNNLATLGKISFNSPDKLNDVEDEPAIGQIGSAKP